MAAFYDFKTVWQEFWDLAAYDEQQNVKNIQGTKKIRKTGWRETRSPPAPRECPKPVLLAILWLTLGSLMLSKLKWSSTALTYYECLIKRFLICHSSTGVISVQRSVLGSFNLFPLYFFLHYFMWVPLSLRFLFIMWGAHLHSSEFGIMVGGKVWGLSLPHRTAALSSASAKDFGITQSWVNWCFQLYTNEAKKSYKKTPNNRTLKN